MNWKYYPITPMGKPRMTQRDKWKQRPCVMRYRDFKDQCRERGVKVSTDLTCRFVLPMPKSWSDKKRRTMMGKPHQQKPDIDNLIKALLDAVLEDDAKVWRVTAEKIWGIEGSVNICQS